MYYFDVFTMCDKCIEYQLKSRLLKSLPALEFYLYILDVYYDCI